MNKYFSYRCKCGQSFGKDLFAKRYVCRMCMTPVIYRSQNLTNFVKPNSIVDLIYSKEKPMSTHNLLKEIHINLLQFRLIELANNVIIYYNDTFFLIKNRRPIYDDKGIIDINATHKYILSREYYVIDNNNSSVISDVIDNLMFHSDIEIRDFVIKVN